MVINGLVIVLVIFSGIYRIYDKNNTFYFDNFIVAVRNLK